ncbi:MAG TPA: ABC transporter substrate-binding protein, partial [Chloroflexota bacterium]|nr:ABC transporter substrate-binding protein [Chloroflexota bacterium]
TRREFLRRATLAGLSVRAVGALFAACGPPAPGAPAGQAPPPAAPGTAAPAGSVKQPRRGGTFTTTGHQNVTGLSPEDNSPTVFWVVIGNIHEGLLKVDENYKVVPRLAERYEVSPDGKTWTFNLRQGVRWHDGQPFTSADVKYNFDWVRDPANAAIGQPLFQEVERVEAPDDATVVVTLKQPNAPFAALTATRWLVPKHVHEKIGEKAYKQQPVGTGPYKLKEFKPAEYTLLEANEDYWLGRPRIDFWRQDIVPEVAVRAVALQTGKADSATWPLTPEDNLKLMEDRTFRHYRAPSLAVNHFPVNNTRPILADKRVRQAMLYAMDRDALVQDLMKGLAVKATANISPGLEAYYEPNVKQYPRDLEQARTLLREAGWTPGPDGILVNSQGERFQVTCIVYVGDTLRRSEAEIVQRHFREVGIEMELRETEPTTALHMARQGDFELQLFNWTYGGLNGDPDASLSLRSTALNNFSHWQNAQADRLLDQGAAELDPEKRRPYYSELQKLVAEEVPFLYVMYW